ncbi:hypothetical protein BGZ96_003178 [Linnemannia gamsii]|uniref:F-box domain-containing protein n=1 Tax=Linnemannia gamsii TaxID=64522 RepID=A0ABQ7K8I2_9FUNG|nr:hypothetical protein BGZ96_003178 [Linnemannia gamsii]
MRAAALTTNAMQQQKPLNIPEIRTNVGWCLDRCDVFSCALSEQVNAHGFDFLRRSKASLTFLRLIRKPFEPGYGIDPVQDCIPPDVCVDPSTSRLTKLSLHKISLNREGFDHTLRSSPNLNILNLTTSCILTGGYIETVGAGITGSDYDLDQDGGDDSFSEMEVAETVVVDGSAMRWRPFRHQGIIELAASLRGIFEPDPNVPSLSLLRHFPRLEELYLSDLELISWVKPSIVREEVNVCCPDLCIIGFRSSPSPAVEKLVTHAFDNLTEVQLEGHAYTFGVFYGLLHHHKTLTSIVTFTGPGPSFDSTQPEPLDNVFKVQGRAIQLLLQILPLTYACFHEHKMKIEWMEEKPWRGTLEDLFVRIEGLDTEQKTEKTLTAWVECWNKYNDAVQQSEGISSSSPLVEDSKVDVSGVVKQVTVTDSIVKLEHGEGIPMTSQSKQHQNVMVMLAPKQAH